MLKVVGLGKDCRRMRRDVDEIYFYWSPSICHCLKPQFVFSTANVVRLLLGCHTGKCTRYMPLGRTSLQIQSATLTNTQVDR
jgi:hypothetical protein